MRAIGAAALLTVTLLAAPASLAAERTVTLSVPGMFCASCPYIVKAAIAQVEGVQAVETSLESRTAVVTFDDAVTTIDALTRATANVGYESSPLEAGKAS